MRAGHSLTAKASWYCNFDTSRARWSKCMAVHPDRSKVFDAYAAAGPRLRVAMGGGVSVNAPDPWRNKIVTVCGRTCQRVRLSDWCACNTDPAHPKLLDLYYDVFELTGSAVTVSW